MFIHVCILRSEWRSSGEKGYMIMMVHGGVDDDDGIGTVLILVIIPYSERMSHIREEKMTTSL